MPEVLLNTGTATLGELIGNDKTYMVPPYQRDYAWDEEEWDDLWQDILGLEEERIHYMGYVVLQSGGGKRYQIIDGQQRFATLSIVALAVIKVFEDWIEEGIDPEPNKERKELLRTRFLGYKDPSSLVPTSKLKLNRNNDDFYRSYLLRLRKPQRLSASKPSQRKMRKSFEYFYEKISAHFKDNKEGKSLSKFLNEIIADKLVFTTITVDDDLNAYKVFETLNARGVKLSTTDLLKNLLFSIVAKSRDEELEEAERLWQNINNTLGNMDFPTFLRYYWNSKYDFTRKQGLFKAIKRSISSAKDVFRLLDELDRTAPVYVAFSNPGDEMWDKEARQYIGALTLFNVTQCYSLLIAAYDKIAENEFKKLLRDCMVISFRYNVIGNLNANIMETIYNKAAIRVSRGEALEARIVFKELMPIYVADDNFRHAFATKVINTKRRLKLVRYILFALENQAAQKEYDFEDSTATIEHILPENPSDNWETYFSTDEQEVFKYRLGNLTLIEPKKNKLCGTKLFEEKLRIYRESSYKLTSGEKYMYTDWTPSTLAKRQEKMANIAITVWKINYK